MDSYYNNKVCLLILAVGCCTVLARETSESTIEIYDKCTNIFTTPEVVNIVRNDKRFGNSTCDQLVQKALRARLITYQIQFTDKSVINQSVSALTSAYIKENTLIMIDKANITEGPLNGSTYYAIRYFNNSEFYQCNKDPGLQNLKQMHGIVYFVNGSNENGLFSCMGTGISKYHPGLIFAYADVPQVFGWFESGKQLAMDFLPYLYVR